MLASLKNTLLDSAVNLQKKSLPYFLPHLKFVTTL